MLRWFSYRPYTYAEIAAKYLPRIHREVPTDPYLILYTERPIGYIQTYRISDHPAYNQYVQADEHTAGLDLFIGEEEYIHRGLGSSILREFLQQVVFAQDWAESCVVGPEQDNRIAIRAYEKVGFRYWKMVQIPDEPQPEILLRIHRRDITMDAQNNVGD